MPKKLMFPKLAAEIPTLSDEQITSALEAHLAIVQKIADGDEETLADLDVADVTSQLEAAVTEVEALRAEQSARSETSDAAAAKVAELAGKVLPAKEKTPEELAAEAAAAEGETDEQKAEREAAEAAAEAESTEEPSAEEAAAAVAAEAEQVAIAASAAERARRVPARRALPAAKGGHKPEKRETPKAGERVAVITAAGDLPGYSAGQELPDGTAIAAAMIAKHKALGRSILQGDGDKVPVATITASAEPERTLGTDEQENMVKISAVTSRTALAASGGICAPATPYYGLMELAVADRPVRDALPRFNADRGAIRFATPPGLSIVDDAIGYITAEEDGEGGTFALKSCQAVVCPEINEVDVAIIYHCVQFGNLGARTWPEQVAQFNELVLAAHARLAEQALLDGIAAASTATVGTAWSGGAVSTILGQIITAAAAYRSRQRMDRNAQLRVMLPTWVQDALQVDVLRSQFARFDNTDATFDQQLSQANVTATYYMDTPTGAGQVFPAQAGSGAALSRFPATCVWFLFAEGSFMYIDGGVLELGIVRDSTLNSHNDYQIFGETFENVAFLGLESIECVSTFCANGITSAPAAPGACAA